MEMHKRDAETDTEETNLSNGKFSIVYVHPMNFYFPRSPKFLVLHSRYLYIRWSLDLSSVVVFVGECGDTDYEGLLGGVHKTMILKGVATEARKLHANRNYPLDDVISFDTPNIVQVEGCNSNDIRTSLGKLGILKG